MTNIVLFSEDALIERAAHKIIAVENPKLIVANAMGRRGFAYFQSRVDAIRKSASALKFLVFLDGDELGKTCPGDAIKEWFKAKKPENIHVRFAFHEVESWLLADRENLAKYLGISSSSIPQITDSTRDTKEMLVRLAAKSRNRRIVEDIVPRKGFTATVGPAYNARVSEFIRDAWDVKAAAAANQSLARACKRIAEL
jgi:hypothetical protein